MSNLTRFWIEFDASVELPVGIKLGCGVTALDYDDAIRMISARIFRGQQVKNVKAVTENVDISTLDSGHVLPNMSIPSERGIWFPMGYR